MALADDWSTWVLVLAALGLIAYIVNANLKARRAAPADAGGTAGADEGEAADSSAYLARFVTDVGGKTVGESVSVAKDRLIVKEAAGYASVPLGAVEPTADGVGLRLTKAVDWDEARRLGEAWRAKSFKVIQYSPEELPPDERE